MSSKGYEDGDDVMIMAHDSKMQDIQYCLHRIMEPSYACNIERSLRLSVMRDNVQGIEVIYQSGQTFTAKICLIGPSTVVFAKPQVETFSKHVRFSLHM